MESETTVNRRYVFAQKELQAALRIEGDIKQVGQWRGQSPAEEDRGASKDKCAFFIETEEKGRDAAKKRARCDN